MGTRQRLPSASYNAPIGDSSIWSRETLAELPVAVVSGHQRDPIAMARHVAGHISSPSPFFVMDVAGVQHRLNSLAACLPSVTPTFDVACNADPVLARVVANSDRDVVFEVTNNDEIEAALKHVEATRILVRSNVLTRKTIKAVGETMCGAMVIESMKHLDDVSRFAAHTDLLLAIALTYSTCEVQMGCLLEEAEEIIVMAHCLGVPLVGIAFDLGPSAQPHMYLQAMRETRKLVEFGAKRGLDMTKVHMGSIHMSNDYEKTLSTIERIVETSMPAFVTVHANLGTFIANDAFTLCTSITAKQQLAAKDITNDEFDDGVGFVYQTDEGFYGAFGLRQMDNSPLCQPLHTMDDEPEHLGTVIGPTLDQFDVAQTLVKCRQLQVGEWLVWQQMGAFTIPLVDDELDQKTPVYYYSRRESWDQLMSREEQRRSPSPTAETDSVTGDVLSDSETSDVDVYDVVLDLF